MRIFVCGLQEVLRPERAEARTTFSEGPQERLGGKNEGDACEGVAGYEVGTDARGHCTSIVHSLFWKSVRTVQAIFLQPSAFYSLA